MSQFLRDVLKGLSAEEKFLQSKYFYNAKGDALFKKIMSSPEYYPTRCELEIFTQQTTELVSVFTEMNAEFDIVELGAGDATKSIYLLKELIDRKINFTYFPVDISGNIITQLHSNLPPLLPGLRIQGLKGEYFTMLEKVKTLSDKIKVILFLGGNIGNVPYEKAGEFCRSIREHLLSGDMMLIGFDLKKNPKTILDAYNDKTGYTRDFNLNLLYRINDELDGNLNPSNFYHYPTYDPSSGACKSYLVSNIEHEATIAGTPVYFKEGEPIFMEIAQKYTMEQTDQLAAGSGFKPVRNFLDKKRWFVDVVWRCI